MKTGFSQYLMVGLLAVGLGMATPALAITMTANFDGGNSTEIVDAYTGMAGGGWAAEWVAAARTSNAPTTITASVAVPGDPGFAEVMTGGGNYLDFAATYTTPDPPPTKWFAGAVGRDYRGGIDLTRDHTIQFKLRIDEDLTSPTTTFKGQDEDVYNFYMLSYVRSSSSASKVWGIAGTAIPDPNNPFALIPGNWVVPNGTHDGSVTNVDSGIQLQQNVTYDFQIQMRPATGQGVYDVRIDNGTMVFDSTTLYPDGLGYQGAGLLSDIGGVLNFGAKGGLDPLDVRQFSLDGLVITQEDLLVIPGDTNGDSIVDATDAAKVATNWGATVSGGATDGDFNDDNAVNAADASILAANWGSHVAGESVAGVPEPSCIVLLLAMTMTMLLRRRRSSRS